MKKISSHKPGKEQTSKHEHHAHPFAAFFGCCLNDEPAAISEKIQQLREQLPDSSTEELSIIPGQPVIITKDMIIGDVIANFPLAHDIFEEIHPLGLLSPRLDQISIEMFLSDLNTDPDQICASLNSLINA